MERNYIDLFDRAARTAGSRAALIDDSVTLTYPALSDATNRLANALIAEGFAPEAPFAILSPNASLALVAMIGAMRAGGAWSNINFRNALAMNIDILKRGGCQLLFFHSSVAGHVAEIRAGVPSLKLCLCVDRDTNAGPSVARFSAGASDARVNVRVPADGVAFQGSTGGTTGAPKITQGGGGFFTGWVLGFMTELTFETPPVTLAVTPISHAGGLFAIMTLAMAGTVVLMPAADFDLILRNIETHRVLFLFLPPTLIYMLMNHPGVRTADLRSLRYLLSAAAPITAEKLIEAYRVFGPVICQAFRQTESGAPLTFLSPTQVREAIENPALAKRLKSVGLPTAVADVEIMNEAGEILPADAMGEIVVRSPMVMHRYAGDPAATEAIKRHGWQHTGDLGYRDADGFIYVSDRKRDLIISGGFNIFPLDVEQVLTRHPAVQDCAVIGVPDAKWGEAVKAVVELAPGATVSEAELIALCKEALGPVIAPKSVDFIAELPRSPVGKVLKRELRARYWKDRDAQI